MENWIDKISYRTNVKLSEDIGGKSKRDVKTRTTKPSYSIYIYILSFVEWLTDQQTILDVHW